MGPQPFGCGRAHNLQRQRRGAGASMGPQPFGCGRAEAHGQRQGDKVRFNGAATFRLRKGRACLVCVKPLVASMGPQPFGCGRYSASFAHPLFLMLQWGRNLSVAEGRRSAACRARSAASMGPQPFGCGRCGIAPICRARQSRFNGAATFRLRKGKEVSLKFSGWLALQWGRNLSVAEGPLGLHRRQPKLGLQWGRNLSVAEGAVALMRSREMRAASMGPQPFGCGRRTTPAGGASRRMLQWGRNLSVAEGADSSPRAAIVRKLQWGRNLSVAEGARTSGHTMPRSLRFNGAATFRLRKARPSCPAGGGEQSFNGAATFRLRKASPKSAPPSTA